MTFRTIKNRIKIGALPFNRHVLFVTLWGIFQVAFAHQSGLVACLLQQIGILRRTCVDGSIKLFYPVFVAILTRKYGARLGEQMEFLQAKPSKSIPSRAILSMFGVFA